MTQSLSDRYRMGESLNTLARATGLGRDVVRKVLVAEGVVIRPSPCPQGKVFHKQRSALMDLPPAPVHYEEQTRRKDAEQGSRALAQALHSYAIRYNMPGMEEALRKWLGARI